MSPKSTQKLVLCVDDDELMLRHMGMYLELEGYRGLAATTGTAALETIAAVDKLYAAVLDYSLPDLSGGEIAAAIRRTRPELPVILFTGTLSTIPAYELKLLDFYLLKEQGMQAVVEALDQAPGLPRPKQWPVRRFPRFAVELPMVVEVSRDGQRASLHGLTTTLAEGGLGGKLDRKLLPGEAVSVSISGPGPAPLRAQAEVRYRCKDSYGLQFLGLDPSQQTLIRAWCRQASPRRAPVAQSAP